MEKQSIVLDQCLEALLEKDRLAYLGFFVQGFIHNVNGPLQNMSMLVELLQRGQEKQEEHLHAAGLEHTGEINPLLAKQKQRIQQLGSQVESLAEMLRVFMVLRQIERSSADIDINLLLFKLSSAFMSDLFFKHQVTLDLRLAKNLPLIQIPGHRIVPALVQVIRNAVTALKLSPVRRLVIESSEKDGGILIEISDSGCGLSQEGEIESCFDLFTSGWQSEVFDYDAGENPVGFGLYGVRRLLCSYGVAVELKSLEKGISALIKIPAERCGDRK